jgi:hypothetical protein
MLINYNSDSIYTQYSHLPKIKEKIKRIRYLQKLDTGFKEV